MRKLISITFGLSLLFSLTGHGQTNVGVFLNPTVDYLNGDSYHINYSLGLKSDIKIYKGIYIKVSSGYEHDFSDYTKMARLQLYDSWIDYNTTKSIKTDIQIKYDFLFKNNFFSFYIFSGPSFTTCIDASEKWSNNVIKEKKGLWLSNILISGGLGLGLKIKHTILINIEPMYATPIWSNSSSLTGFGNRFGLNIGVAYMFKE